MTNRNGSAIHRVEKGEVNVDFSLFLHLVTPDENAHHENRSASSFDLFPKLWTLQKVRSGHFPNLPSGGTQTLKKSFTQEQIVATLHSVENGASVADTLRKLGITEPIFYRPKRNVAGLGVSEVRRLKQLEVVKE